MPDLVGRAPGENAEADASAAKNNTARSMCGLEVLVLCASVSYMSRQREGASTDIYIPHLFGPVRLMIILSNYDVCTSSSSLKFFYGGMTIELEERLQMPRTEDAAAEIDSRNATQCDNCSKVLQKPLVCARCKTATYCSKDWHTAHRKRGGLAIKAISSTTQTHTQTRM